MKKIIKKNKMEYCQQIVSFNKIKNENGEIDQYLYSDPDIILVFNEYCDNNGKDSIRYFLFKSVYSFFIYVLENSSQTNVFHEVIFGNKPQKIYIDIDMELNDDNFLSSNFHLKSDKIKIAETIIDETIEAIKKARPLIKDEDILVLNSNSEEKVSYHIIVDRWIFSKSEDNEDFFNDMLSYINPQLHRYYDKQMYSNIRNFRVYMNYKYKKGRILKVDEKSRWIPDDLKLINDSNPNKRDYQYNKEIFLASLITNNNYCSFLNTKDKPEDNYENSELSSINEVYIDKILKVFNKLPESNYFEHKVEKNRIFLKRKKESYCNVCERIHENQNSYLFLTNKNDIWLNCLRNSKSYKIGNINNVSDVKELKDNNFSTDIKVKVYTSVNDNNSVKINKETKLVIENCSVDKNKAITEKSIIVRKETPVNNKLNDIMNKIRDNYSQNNHYKSLLRY
jgi:hypothetical protein